jgi:rRNA maturation endonuclease Nob1
VSLFVVVSVTWFVIVRDARDVLDESAHYVTCGSCSHSIQSEWRMCPFCGSEVRPAATEVRSSAGDAAPDAAGAVPRS